MMSDRMREIQGAERVLLAGGTVVSFLTFNKVKKDDMEE